jgi:hypothetical protein
MFCSKWTPHTLHLRLHLWCEIVMRNQFSLNKSTIVYTYIKKRKIFYSMLYNFIKIKQFLDFFIIFWQTIYTSDNSWFSFTSSFLPVFHFFNQYNIQFLKSWNKKRRSISNLMCTWGVSGNTFIRYTQSLKVGKPNNCQI